MSVPRILVIGGAGYLGSVLVRELLACGWPVRVLDSFRFGREALEADDVRTQPGLDIVEGDIRCIGTVTAALADVDGVVLLAALVGEPACDTDPKETVDINLLATQAVAHGCLYHGVRRFVFASTDSIYGIREGTMEEDSAKNPLSLYARLKLQAEEEILGLATTDFQPTILRMCTLYGWSPRMRFDLVVNALALRAETDRRITIHGGAQWRPFVHVVDAATAYRLALDAPLDLVGSQIFNVGSDEQNYQIGALPSFISQVWPDVAVDTVPQSPDLRDYAVTCRKIERVLGYRAERSIVDGLHEIRQALVAGSISDTRDPRHYNVSPA
jgi:nucleoside-diphosphate-sugar epimerase